MMTVCLTCSDCGSAIDVYPKVGVTQAQCGICNHLESVKFNENHVKGILEVCPKCDRQDFYVQKDFNRKIGVLLFIIASILSIWTYGISLIVLYLFDLLLFRKLGNVACCYKCQTLFRRGENFSQIPPFDHEMNDRIVYADHQFKGRPTPP